MAWPEVMQKLETEIEGHFKGTFRPRDNVPFFRVQYPPQEEREALRQFRNLAERLRKKNWQARCVSLTEISQKAFEHLLNTQTNDLLEKLRSLEGKRERSELQKQLCEHLPSELAKAVKECLTDMPREGVAILLRMGSLYPFVRSSSIESKLEGQVLCAVVLSYPGTTLGALLDSRPVDPHGGYYRGEIIAWE